MNRKAWGAGLMALLGGLAGCLSRSAPIASPDRIPDAWLTRAERTHYEETARYDEVVDFCRRLAAASRHAHYTSFGSSAEGRELPLLILSQERAFTPKSALASRKLRILVQNCIHAGECEGKDASLELARDILITGRRRALLNEVNLLIMPIFSADGHERFSPGSRINQNGPRECGWRVTANNLNLNREYMKADAVEMQAWLRFWVAWRPDFLFDNHTTDGADYQYDLFYSTTLDADCDPFTGAWLRETLLPTVLPKLAADGHLALPQVDPRDPRDWSKGLEQAGAFPPRFSTGYAAIGNRPSILIETHALKPYRQRVRATYNMMVRTLEELNQRPELLRAAIEAADAHDARTRGAGLRGRLTLRLARGEGCTPITFHAIEEHWRVSPITGGEVVEYTGRPLDVETQLYDRWRVEKAVTPPAAYLVPPQWADVIARLDWHGIEYFQLARAESLDVEVYRFDRVKFAERPSEGRQRPSYETSLASETRAFRAGTVVVPMNQRHARLAAHLLEPEAPDSLVSWGLFNTIFEPREYAEAYVMEPIAQRMLAADPALREEFEQRVRTDEAFAKSPGARLDFFYRRSPYWDATHNVYPVARLVDEGRLSNLRRASPGSAPR